MSDRKKYYGIDWLRVIACTGIVMMHMLANNSYVLSGYLFEKVVPSFTNFTFLFMTISAFGMCCGYYEKVMKNGISWTVFYKKRYLKILPFFTCLVLLELVIGFSKETLFEAIADISLLFGLFPNDITVIGVGWFLGVVFAFYLIFPFFCVLIENKRRAWLAFVASLVMNYIGENYFGLERTNIVFDLCFFLAGGLIYLYKDDIEKLKWFLTMPGMIIVISIYYFCGANTYSCLLVSAIMIICALSVNVGNNRGISFISGISMEIYLSHMFIFRVIEKLHLNTIFGNGIVQYVFSVVVVFVGTVIFSYVMQKLIEIAKSRIGVSE